MLKFNPDKHNCTGCSACSSICPKNCIKMVRDDEGFLYPELGEGCINCGLCEKVCPLVKPSESPLSLQKVYWAITKDFNLWRSSSSGGAFTEICRLWGDSSTMIYGAAWDSFSIHHIGVQGVENIAPLRKSKYISSDLEDSFPEIKKLLNENKKVVFSGTPCQVTGLNSFLRKDYPNLLTIDLICHGIGSPYVFQTCIEAIEKQFGQKVKAYQFRAKKSNYDLDHLSIISLQNKDVYIDVDRYNQLFLNQMCLRPSCGSNCKFRDVHRPGDITLADFRGTHKIFPKLMGIRKNYSSIVSNTEKGLSLINQLNGSMEIKEYHIVELVEFNPLFAKHTWFADNRDSFFEEYKKAPLQTVEKLTKAKDNFKFSWKRRFLNTLPSSLRGKLLMKKIK